MSQTTENQFDESNLATITEFENRIFEFHTDAKIANIIPDGFRSAWALAMDQIQMILMSARTLCREKRDVFDFSRPIENQSVELKKQTKRKKRKL
jgi:hypothetical protein